MTAPALQPWPAWKRAAGALRTYAATGQLGITVMEAREIADALSADLRKPLTERQRQIYDYIKTHIADHGYAPSFTDIMGEFQFGSMATVHEHLTNLERKGWIRRAFNEARAISLVEVPG